MSRVTQTHNPPESPDLRAEDPDRTDMSVELPVLLRGGHVVAGRYRIERFLDRGGMGEVYDAFDLLLEERVAIKVMREPCTADSPFLSRMRTEVQLARRVTHPNVCRIFDMGLDGEMAFLTMELLAGETLAQRIKRGPLGPVEALPLVQQMAAALSAVHAAGVIHRDFKCANVFLVPSENGVRAVVTDFGVARDPERRVSNVTSTGVVMGTPAFMAPEQVRGHRPTPAIDVYALGVVMFNMLTGEYPFDGESAYSVAARRVKEDAPSPRVHVPDLDPAWEATIMRCLEREPEARFASVAEVAAALQPEELEVAEAPLPRRQVMRWFAGAMVAAAVIATVVGLMVGGSEDPVKPPRTKTSVEPTIVLVEPVAAPAPAPKPASVPAPASAPDPVPPPPPEAKKPRKRAVSKPVSPPSKPKAPVVDDDAPLPIP